MLTLTNIGRLYLGHAHGPVRGAEMAEVPHLDGPCWLSIDAQGRVADYGPGQPQEAAAETLDCRGGYVLPSYCDSHTHIIYAGHRDGEYEDKLRGLSYEDIARRGGGILNSADLLARTSEDELYEQSLQRLHEVIAKGTGAIDIKSGYGLTLDNELKMLRVAQRLRQATRARVNITYLAAHATPRGMDIDRYVDEVVTEMVPEVGRQQLADTIDVFCDRGFFTPQHTRRILEAGARWGLKPKIHADELASSGGTRVGVAHGALSVDHLENLSAEDTRLLAMSDTVGTCLPGASFFSRLPYAPARALIEQGAAVALASDYNPGSSPSGDMRMVMALGCIQMRLSPEEALNAATVNGAAAMGLDTERYGTLRRGAVANMIVTRPLPSLAFITYAYTTPYIARVIVQGKEVTFGR